MRVYLDHNATTPLRAEARQRWLEVVDGPARNASSVHAAGRAARAVVDEARERVAGALGVGEDELLFTSGGTEANNLALFGVVGERGPEAALATTAVEHSSVLEAARALEAAGHPLRLVGVDPTGVPDPEELGRAARDPACALVSAMAANNEVGSSTDLTAVAARLAEAGPDRPRLHTDAVQALGRLPVRLADWGVDLASFSAHKVGGPPGVGILWRRPGIRLRPLLHGGGQEGGLRPGTEDVAGIAATAVAMELAVEEQESYAQRTSELVRYLWGELTEALPSARLLGPPLDAVRLPNTLCVLVPGSDGKVLVTRLDLEGLEVSAGSACASGSVEPSHVLLAMGNDEGSARSALRISLGRNTSRDECKHAAVVLKKLFAVSHAT